MEEDKVTLERKISFFQILPRMMKFRRQKNQVSFTVVHSDEPREDTSNDGSLLQALSGNHNAHKIKTGASP